MDIVQSSVLLLVSISITGLVTTYSFETIIKQSITMTTMQEETENAAAIDITRKQRSLSSNPMTVMTSNHYVKVAGFTSRLQLNTLKLYRKSNNVSGEQFWGAVNHDLKDKIILNNKNKTGEGSFQQFLIKGFKHCPSLKIECDNTRTYRTFDGSCNNLKYPADGLANTAFIRLLPPSYADDVEAPRLSKTGKPLSSARKISVSIFEDIEKLSTFSTVMIMTFGQLLDHDVDKTAISKLIFKNGTLVDYSCGQSGCETDGLNKTECLPIEIPENDPDFKKQCIKFVRSQEFPRYNCELGPREQVNTITSWLDASFVYGSSLEQSHVLHNFNDTQRGKLKVTPHPLSEDFKPLLPLHDNDPSCRDLDKIVRCFLTGDSRQNVQVGLIAMHTVFVRLHNHFEEQLHLVNPQWNGEKLFQETRKLVIAVWQNIVYTEYLPLVLGPQYLRKYQIHHQSDGHFKGYENSTEGQGNVFNAFATAAFRFGHSQIGDKIRFSSSDYTKHIELPFSSVLFRPRTIYESPIDGVSGLDAVVFGMISQRSENSDRFFSKEITSKLFSDNPHNGLGKDLGALNTQRGRDHGIPSYIHWRKWCKLTVASKFEKLDDISENVRQKLASVYSDVEDIDLYVGAISEEHVAGGIVGPTFACLIGHQFRNLRVADRFWFENKMNGLTEQQIQNIHEFTLSKIFCLTLDDMNTVQKYSMLLPLKEALDNLGTHNKKSLYEYVHLYKNTDNVRVPCSHLSDIDFGLWRYIP